jgi:ferric-dicitrate binding protein FerR (iron transport regulator)
MDPNRCPSAEDWAVFAIGAASEAEWRRRVRHLAECEACRRHTALLALSDGSLLPPARLPAPAPPRPRFSRIAFVARVAAAAVFLGAIAFALRAVYLAPPSGSVAVHPLPPSPAGEGTRKTRPLPELPDALKPKPSPGEAPRRPQESLPPPPGLAREETPAPDPVPARTPDPVPAPPSPYSPVPSLFIAQHSTGGIGEAIEISPAAGSLTVDYDTTSEALARATYVRPSQALRTREGASFSLPDGATVHLAKEGEVFVSWSQTLLCYSIDLHRGEALLDLGAAPRILHVSNGPLGVRFTDSSGQIHLAAGKESLRATPLTGGSEFRGPAGDGRTLAARQTLVLNPDRDSLESSPLDLRLAQLFPTLEVTPPRPAAPRAPAPPVAAGPSAAETLRALPSESYRFRVSGRQLREGAWFPMGVLYSTIDEFAVVKRADGGQSHTRRAQRPWDDLGAVKQGTREDRLVTLLRNSKPPHVQVEAALAASRGEPQQRAEVLQGRACTVSQFALDPAKLRADVGTLVDQAVTEGRMAKPDYIYWDTLEGTLEITCQVAIPCVVRATDRRRVSYSYNSVSGLLRRAYVLETVYDFFDHGKASLKLPGDILKEMDPQQK